MRKHSSYIGRTLAGRYEVRQLLGEGAMGQVFAVWDQKTQRERALKLIDVHKKKLPLEAVMRFKSEATILKNLKHPSIIKYIDFFQEGDIYGLVMEYSLVSNLKQYLREHEKLTAQQVLPLLKNLAEALAFIHEQGLVHLDLKSSNILLKEELNDLFSVKIVDFGFSQLIGTSGSQQGGTLSYMAPEQTGILHKTIDHRADLYALGIIAYEALVGRVPFKDPDPAILIYQHIAQAPQKPKELQPQIPILLERIILKLLNKDPDDRYRTTNGLLNDLKKYLRLSKRQGSLEIDFLLGEEDHWDSFPPTNPFVGREKEQKAIQKILQQTANLSNSGQLSRKNSLISPQSTVKALRGQHNIVLLEGNQGIGKSMLLKRLYNDLQKQQGSTLFYKARKEEFETPLKTIKSLLESFSLPIYNLPPDAQAQAIAYLRQKFGRRFSIVVEMFPNLELDSDEDVLRDQDFTLMDYHEVIIELFKIIAEKHGRLVIFVDDLQNVEQSSWDLFFKFSSVGKDLPVLFLFTYNHEELTPVRRQELAQSMNLSHLHHFHLPALSTSEFSELFQKLFSSKFYDYPGLLEPIYSATQGSPKLLRMLLQKLIDHHQIFYKKQAWFYKKEETFLYIRSFEHEQTVETNLVDWSPTERQVLQRAAIFQRAFTWEALRNLLPEQPALEVANQELLQILDDAVRMGILSVDRKMLYTYRSHHLRHSLLSEITEKSRHLLHQNIAAFLERYLLPEAPEAVYDIAYHIGNSGDQLQALKYHIRAAELTENERFNDRQAEYYYRQALLNLKKIPLDGVTAELQFRVRFHSIRHTFAFSQEYDELWAEHLALEAWIQGNKKHHMQFLYLKAILCFSRGMKPEMLQHLEQVLQMGTESEDGELVLDACIFLGSVVSDKSYSQRVALLLRGIEMAIEHKKHYKVIESFNVLSILLSYLGRFQEAEQLLDKYLSQVSLKSEEEAATARLWPQISLERNRGNYQLALEYSKKLQPYIETVGPVIRDFHKTNLAISYGMTGQYKESLQLFDELLQGVNHAKQRIAILPILLGRVELALKMDDPEMALSFLEQSHEPRRLRPDPYMDVLFLIYTSDAYTRLQEFSEATLVLEEAAAVVDRLDSPLLACHWEFFQAKSGWFKNWEEHFLEQGQKALDDLLEMGATGIYEQYQEDYITWSLHGTKTLSTSSSSHYSDRTNFFKLFQINSKITATLEVEELFEAVLEGAMQIVGARQGYLFTCSCSDGVLSNEENSNPCLRLTRDSQGQPIDPEQYVFSQTIIGAVYQNKETIVTRDVCHEKRWEDSKSIFEHQLRSILAVPILLQGSIKGLIYLDNHQATSVFSLQDKEIANIFATQVAIALNNAENHERQNSILQEKERLSLEIHEYNRTLEQKVVARTNELQDLNRNLEKRVQAELDARLRQEQLLIQHSKMAAMGEMIGMIAHQWRQPLSSISTITGNLQVLIELDMINKDDFTHSLSTVNDQVQFLSNTINDFRNFFSPKKKAEKIRLDEVLQRTMKLIGKSMDSKGIEVTEELVFSTPIHTYANELMQVFLNILKNSQDVIEEKKMSHGSIRIKGWETEQHQIVEISDNAGGIDQDIMEKIFEPYFSTKDEKTGTGLGLYMSKMIVEKHCKGELTVRNIAEGACFRIQMCKQPQQDDATTLPNQIEDDLQAALNQIS
ncbi:MAG: hypothetical protein COB67_05555 [SAR324 cluster bacterium]|uniref:histidine kinase n=1 Tax=SAR324 cluster bacterium TaxID=2024889 RepID=A0A2A4T5B9_9DELT|nr:MAG: hypothetical protein COB67_05555 [SAR324 cluster bacterium]